MLNSLLASRRMSLKVREGHSKAGKINVKCNAKIGEAYWQTSQIGITVIKPSYMLESRSSSNSGRNIPQGNDPTFKISLTLLLVIL